MTHQLRYDNWDSTSSCYHSLSTTVNRWPPGDYQAPKYYNVLDIKAEYGIAVEVAESISRVSLWSFILFMNVKGMLTYTGDTPGTFYISSPDTLLGSLFNWQVQSIMCPIYVQRNPSGSLAALAWILLIKTPGNGEGNKQASDAWNKNKECTEGNTSLSVSGDPDGMSIEIPSIETIILIFTKIALYFLLPQCLKWQQRPLFKLPSVDFQMPCHCSNKERMKKNQN